MPEPIHIAGGGLRKLIKYTSAEKDIIWQSGEGERLTGHAIRPEQPLWGWVREKMQRTRTPNACGRKYGEMNSIAKDIKGLVGFDGQRWDPNHHRVVEMAGAWSPVRRHRELRIQVSAFLSSELLKLTHK